MSHRVTGKPPRQMQSAIGQFDGLKASVLDDCVNLTDTDDASNARQQLNITLDIRSETALQTPVGLHRAGPLLMQS